MPHHHSTHDPHEPDQSPAAGGQAPPAEEARLPRQRDRLTHRPALPPPASDNAEPHQGTRDEPGRRARGRAAARRVLARLLAWLRTIRQHWLTYWPELASLLLAARAVRVATRRAGRMAGRSARIVAGSARRATRHRPVLLGGLVRRVGPTARRWAKAAGVAARWVWVRLLCPGARTCGRAVGRAVLWCWRRADPYLRDTGGWLVHTAPRLAARALVRALRRAPGALTRLVRHAIVGLSWLLVRLVRYCLAYAEYAGVLREARDLDRPRRARAAIVAWRRAATRRTTTTLLLTATAGVGLWWLHRTHGALAVAGVLAALIAALAGIGRAVRPLPEHEPGTAPTEPGPDEPFPIADAHTRAEAADCVRRALAAEGTVLRLAGEARRTRWGWEVAVILRSGTPGGIVAKTAELETHLDLPAGGLLVTPDRTRRARVVLRLAERDPFAGLGPPPTRTPGEASITERASIGTRIDGTPLIVPLLGVHGVIIGTSGAGKSTTLRTLADIITTCADALVWDLDPAGCGLDALGPAVGRRERDPAGITHALADALAVAEARPRMLADLSMGPAWQPSPDRPAVVVMVDEYPSLPDKAKTLAVALLRIGRKARVTLLLAATEATSDALGAAIADTAALRILHACRHSDVRLVLGPQMLADGWRPDRLHPATADDPGDAGRCYVHTAGQREPLISAIHPLTETDAHERGTRRAATGLPRLDAQSWAAAQAMHQTQHSEQTNTDPDSTDPPAPVNDPAIRDVLSALGDHPWLWTEDLLTALAHLHSRYARWTADDLAALLRPLGIAPGQIKRGGRNRNGYHRDAIVNAWHHHQHQPGSDTPPGTT